MNKIPILTKDLIRENLDNLIADTAAKSKLIENATGGSTGVPLKFYQDLNYLTIATAIGTFVREWWGILPYDRTAQLWGADRDFHDLSLKERVYKIRQRTKSLNAFRMSDETLHEFCLMLKRWRPPYLMGYSTALEAMALCAQKNKINNLSFKAIRSTAETLWPHQKKLIEEVFNSPVYNFYGSREINNLAAECTQERQMHLISTWRYVEITDEHGRSLSNGESGHITVTDLSNYAMPFIRYRNEDVGILSSELCRCGRPSPVLKEILGRSTDLIRTRKGDIIHGEFFTHLFYGRNDILQFQIHQKSLDRIIVRYVPAEGSTGDYMKGIANKIKARLGENVVVDIEICSEIPVIESSGKHRFTISDLN
jgi:phenylacetate-CoA ligase